MDSANTNRAPLPEYRPPSAGGVVGESPTPSQAPPRPLLQRADSRSTLQPGPRPVINTPQPQQPRPQFQTGGTVTAAPQFAPRPGTPAPRGPAPAGPPGSQQFRAPPPPLRQAGPQSFAQSQPRPLQSPVSNQPPQRVLPPNNLQFGPRQPPQFATTPDGARPQFGPPTSAGVLRPSVIPGPGPSPASVLKQPQQGPVRGPENFSLNLNKSGNLENQNNTTDIQNVKTTENGMDMPGVAKGRSFSIAAAPGAPSPLKIEDDRRKSVSNIGSKIDDFSIRTPGLGLIQEGKVDSKENLRGSKESVRSEISNDGNRDIPERPESRLSGSKMTESFIGSLPSGTPKKKVDDDDDVIANKKITAPVKAEQSKTDSYDRSPSLTRSDESPEPIKQPLNPNPALINKPDKPSPEPPRPKTPKSEIKPEIKPEPKREETRPIETLQKVPPKLPLPLDSKPPMSVPKKPNELNTNSISSKSTPRKCPSAPKSRNKDGDNDSGVDESTQGNDLNGSPGSPNKKASKLPTKEKSNNSLKGLSRSSSKSATVKTPENPPVEKKKVPINKVQVGNAPSPNIKAVKSKIGSLENAAYKPGGGKVKIENRKIELTNVAPKIAAKNDAYNPSGGTKKIVSTKLEWNAKSKIGSLQNTSYKPGGGDKKIETVKLDFKDKAKPKVASTVNITHKPGGGAVKIDNQKLEFKAQSKVGSLDNVKHKPGGGVVKIFDDKEYIKQIGSQSPATTSRSHSRQESPTPLTQPPKSDENLNEQEQHYYMSVREWSDDRPMSRCLSARAPRTPRTPRALSPRKNYDEDEERVQRNNERNRRSSRPATARDSSRAYSRRASVTQRPAFSVY